MIVTKLYKYDSSQGANNYRGEDFSRYILLGDSDVDDLTEVLDVIEITLAGLPFSEEFEPTTKFIYEKWEEIANEDGTTSLSMWKDWHLCVAEDLVSQPIMSDNQYYDHVITFNEASVCAQGKLVDNISITYKLKDVSLDGKTKIDETQKAKVNIQNVEWTPTQNFQSVGNTIFYGKKILGKRFYWRFPTWFNSDSPYYGEESDWTNFDYYQEVVSGSPRTVSFPVPFLEIQNGNKDAKTFTKLGYCSVTTVVEETEISTGSKRNLTNQQTNPCSNVAEEYDWTADWASQEVEYNQRGVVLNRYKYKSSFGLPDSSRYIKQIAKYDSLVQNRKITFEIRPNCVYTIKVYLKDFKSPDGISVGGNVEYDKSCMACWSSESSIAGYIYWSASDSYQEVNNEYPQASMTFMTYEAGTDKKIWLKSAPPENAYNLYIKAQINTQNLIKTSYTPITEEPQSYYVSPADKEELQNTRVIENFYNQKNWWEMQLEIGKYIHAIPKIRFGSNDRFLTTWRKLGKPDQYEDYANKISIFNSKSVENYISACSSYISNMVQLGGIIEEWVAPKSSSDDYLVYNDVAEIITSKNIIEIVDMEAKCVNSNSYGITVGDVRNLAGNGPSFKNGFIFEKNVYDLLSVSAASLSNKGLAMYYSLGDNKIKGLTYQLPTINTGSGDNDYAIKRILGTVFGISSSSWPYIKVNDFVFHIKYRTKDTVRSDQTRPDLRKYMVNSRYDPVPQHNQFNNQTDIVVDSVKFGNNIYGKLIRTGNTSYMTTEWVSSLFQLKEAGQLYNIRGDLYYVAKVKNTYFKDHIISEVTYSKDYNQLSEIIGIPSEPRFYEISEQSLIKREVPLNDYIMLRTTVPAVSSYRTFIQGNGWTFVKDLLFGNVTEFPKYAITVFKNDRDRKYGTVPDNEAFYKDVCHPISAYSIENTLTLEWDMVDNFSAGDAVTPTGLSIDPATRPVDSSYSTLDPVKYTDVYGRSDLLDFLIMQDFDTTLTKEQIRALPNSPVRTFNANYFQYVGTIASANFPTAQEFSDFVVSQTGESPRTNQGVVYFNTSTQYSAWRFTGSSWDLMDFWEASDIEKTQDYQRKSVIEYIDKYLFGNEIYYNIGDNWHGLGLMKDNREQISLNFNLQMLTDSDRFVLSAYLWQPNKTNLKLALLTDEINKISNETIQESVVSETLYDFTAETITRTSGAYSTTYIKVNIANALSGVSLDGVKAIAIISTDDYNETIGSGAKLFVMGRNITGLTEATAKQDWYISSVSQSMFNRQ